MVTRPGLEYRSEKYYVAIRKQVSIPFGELLPPLWGEVGAWLAGKGMAPSGVPFIRYLTTDMAKKLDIEVGFPVVTAVPGDERISAGVIPAGRYATLVYSGPYDNEGLVNATAGLLAWAEANHITWQTSIRDQIEWWEARYEFYLTNPAEEPDSQKWQTELAFLVAEK